MAYLRRLALSCYDKLNSRVGSRGLLAWTSLDLCSRATNSPNSRITMPVVAAVNNLNSKSTFPVLPSSAVNSLNSRIACCDLM